MLLKDIVDHFNVEIELSESLLNIDLPINKMFDNYEIKSVRGPKYHWFSYNDSPITLRISKNIEYMDKKYVNLDGAFGEECDSKSYYENGEVYLLHKLTKEQSRRFLLVH